MTFCLLNGSDGGTRLKQASCFYAAASALMISHGRLNTLTSLSYATDLLAVMNSARFIGPIRSMLDGVICGDGGFFTRAIRRRERKSRAVNAAAGRETDTRLK